MVRQAQFFGQQIQRRIAKGRVFLRALQVFLRASQRLRGACGQ